MISQQEKIYKIRHLESEREDWKAKAERLENQINKIYEEFKKDISQIQFKFIEILAIFVMIIGFLFGFVGFSTSWIFSFQQTFFLIFLFGMILYGFVLIIHKLFS